MADFSGHYRRGDVREEIIWKKPDHQPCTLKGEQCRPEIFVGGGKILRDKLENWGNYSEGDFFR